MKRFYIILCVLLCLSCIDNTKGIDIILPAKKYDIDDKMYITDSTYKKGDVRRYGIFPNEEIAPKSLNNILDLANKGLPLYFPKGYYNTSITIEALSNVSLYFDDVIIGGGLQIINKDEKQSQYIEVLGRLTILDKLFIRQSNNISFDEVSVESDTINNIYKKDNRGVSIYVGSKQIQFKSLAIENTGGTSDDFYKHTAAALQIHGWNNNPENISINRLQINNASRTAVYLTGNSHQLDKVTISNFGLGSNKNMFGLDDASPGEETDFSAIWINKCNNCIIDSLQINNPLNRGQYSLRLDEGKYHQPTFINNIQITNKAKELPIKDDKLTNVLVKHEY